MGSIVKAIQVKRVGGPEVLEWLVDISVPEPKANEAVVKIAASGVNYVDVYYREVRYRTALPFVAGQEGAGGHGLPASRHGGAFTLRAEVLRDHVRIEVEDAGGPWSDGPQDDGRPHGFDVVAALAGPGNWGIDGDARWRVAWARLGG